MGCFHSVAHLGSQSRVADSLPVGFDSLTWGYKDQRTYLSLSLSSASGPSFEPPDRSGVISASASAISLHHTSNSGHQFSSPGCSEPSSFAISSVPSVSVEYRQSAYCLRPPQSSGLEHRAPTKRDLAVSDSSS